MNTRRRRSTIWSLLAAIGVATTAVAPARAQEGDASRAEALFLEAREARDRGDLVVACAKFAESLALLKRPNTMLQLAECQRKQGRLAEAFEVATAAMAIIPPEDERLAIAKEIYDDVGARVPKLTVKFSSPPPRDAVLRVDAREMVAADVREPLALDPGVHKLTLTVPGRAASSVDVTLAERERREITLDLGLDLSAAPPPKPLPVVEPPVESGSGSSLPIIGLVVGGGLATLGLGTAIVTGAIIVGNDGTIQDECGEQRCTQQGLDTIDSSETLIAVNYVGWGVAAAGVVLGTTLILVGMSSDDEPAASLSIGARGFAGGGGLGANGRF